MTATLFTHPRQHGLGQCDGCEEIHFHDAAVDVQHGFVGQRALRNACVVDQYIQTVEISQYRTRGVCKLIHFSDIERQHRHRTRGRRYRSL